MNQINGQNSPKYFEIKFTDTIKSDIKDKYTTRKSYLTKKEILSEIDNISKTLHTNGYLAHSIRLLQENDSLFIGIVTPNQETKHITLRFDSKEDLPKFITNNELTIPFSELEQTLHSIYTYYEKSGASFTDINLREITPITKGILAQVEITKSKKRTIDKVVVKGYPNFPKKYVKNHLRIKPTTIYNEATLVKTSNSLQKLAFLTEFRKPEVLFTKDSTHLYIYVRKKKSNHFDGLIGFSNSVENGKLQFNGYLDIQLNNSFNKGEQLAVYWSNNGNQQEDFRFKIATPYLFNTPISPELTFEIYKQDSTFITTDFNFNSKYLINENNTIGATIHLRSSNTLLENNTNPLLNSYKTNAYGATYQFNQTSNIKRIFTLNSAFNYGSRNSFNSTTPQYHLILDFSIIEKITQRSSIYIHNKTESLRSNTILFNELFQIGGANSIRGFYEQSIFCSSYNYTNLEYRLLTNSESYLYSYSDIGLTEDQTIHSNDRFYSFGIGYVYKTKNGFVNLNYGFGKKNKESFNFNQGIFQIKLTTTF